MSKSRPNRIWAFVTAVALALSGLVGLSVTVQQQAPANGMIGTYIDLAIKAKKLGIQKLELVPPTVDVVNPNFTAIHAMVQKAFTQTSSAK